MTLLMVLILGGLIAIFAYPILGEREAWDLDAVPDRLRILKRGRDRLMRTLKDLESDYREGTLLESDYQELRQTYKRQAIEASRELTRVRETVVRQIKAGPARPLTSGEREALEKRITRRKKKYQKK
jgi:hypothetical protein